MCPGGLRTTTTMLMLAWLGCAIGCRSSSPTAPMPPATLTGAWAGDVVDSYGGSGQLYLTIDQTQFALRGTFRLEFGDASRNRSGTLSGNAATSSLPARMQLRSSQGFVCAAGQPADSFVQVSWARTGNTLDGTYAGFGCVGPVTGRFTVLRQ